MDRRAATPDVAVVLGSGWLPAADALGATLDERPTSELPGFPAPTVAGHHGSLRRLEVAGIARPRPRRPRPPLRGTHRGRGRPRACAPPCSRGARSSCSPTPRARSTPTWGPGTAVALTDHLNLTNRSPLSGAAAARALRLAVRRPLRGVRRAAARARQRGRPDASKRASTPRCGARTTRRPPRSGCSRTLGADLVGMSTALEAIAARHLGAEVLGLSLVDEPRRGRLGDAARPPRGARRRRGGRPRPRAAAARGDRAAVSAARRPRRRPRRAPSRAWIADDPDAATRAELAGTARRGRRRRRSTSASTTPSRSGPRGSAASSAAGPAR